VLNPAAALARGRAAALALMVDTVTITRVTGTTTDPDTGVVTPTTSTVYTGTAKIQQGAVPLGEPKDLGEASILVVRLEVHLPVSATGVLADDVVTVTASALDPDLVGKRFVIRSVAHKSFLTARRCDVSEVTS
jgi:hypothetical protein